jgi:K+-transporting ATPase KdpF subunit
MSLDNALGLVFAVGLIGYLLVALIFPERLE